MMIKTRDISPLIYCIQTYILIYQELSFLHFRPTSPSFSPGLQINYQKIDAFLLLPPLNQPSSGYTLLIITFKFHPQLLIIFLNFFLLSFYCFDLVTVLALAFILFPFFFLPFSLIFVFFSQFLSFLNVSCSCSISSFFCFSFLLSFFSPFV